MPKIAVLESLTEPGQLWELKRFPFRLGRASDNDLVVTSTKILGEKPRDKPIKGYISGYHAEIRQVGQGYSIVDLKSTNGTYVNGRRINQETSLKTEDRISLGDAYKLVFRAQDSETPPGPITEPLTVSRTVPLKPKE